jgi:hypothetical protein
LNSDKNAPWFLRTGTIFPGLVPVEVRCYLFTNVGVGDLANLVLHSVLNATPNISSIHNLTRYRSRVLAHQWPCHSYENYPNALKQHAAHRPSAERKCCLGFFFTALKGRSSTEGKQTPRHPASRRVSLLFSCSGGAIRRPARASARRGGTANFHHVTVQQAGSPKQA